MTESPESMYAVAIACGRQFTYDRCVHSAFA